MRVRFEHGRRVEIPDRSSRHHVQAKRPEYRKVDCCVDLLHEAVLLGAGADAEVDGERANNSLHEELAGEGEDDNIECHKGEVARPFAILCRGSRASDGVCGY